MSIFEDTTFNDLSDQTLITSLSQQNPVVMILNGADLGTRYTLSDASYVIGRNPEKANIVLNDRAVSAMHTRIDYDARNHNFVITDLKSKNGIWINSKRTSTAPLSPGDKIFIGKTILKFNVEDAFEDTFHSDVDKLMNIDELTGLPVKRIFDHKLGVMFIKALRRGKPLSLLMMDMDGLKSINDTYGHDIGDHVLEKFTKIISLHIRKSDAFIRWGGGEFLIISPNINKQESINFAEKLKVAISSCEFQKEMVVTVSIGVTIFKDGDTKESVLKRADLALYEAKTSGRNNIKYN